MSKTVLIIPVLFVFLIACSDDSAEITPTNFSFKVCKNHLLPFEEGYILIHDEDYNVSQYASLSNDTIIELESNLQKVRVSLLSISRFQAEARYNVRTILDVSNQRSIELCKYNFDELIGDETMDVSFQAPDDYYVNFLLTSVGLGFSRIGNQRVLLDQQYLFNTREPYRTFVFNTKDIDPWGLAILSDITPNSSHVIDVEQSIIRDYNSVEVDEELTKLDNNVVVNIDGFFSDNIYESRAFSLINAHGFDIDDQNKIKIPSLNPQFNSIRSQYTILDGRSAFYRSLKFGNHATFNKVTSEMEILNPTMKDFKATLSSSVDLVEMTFTKSDPSITWTVFSEGVNHDFSQLMTLRNLETDWLDEFNRDNLTIRSTRLYQNISFVIESLASSRLLSNERPDEYESKAQWY